MGDNHVPTVDDFNSQPHEEADVMSFEVKLYKVAFQLTASRGG